MFPWLQSNYNFPLSGNVQQHIDPDWFFSTIDAEVGDGEIEKEVFQKIASYGKQIGLLTEALLSMSAKLEMNEQDIPALKELTELQEKIEVIKTAKKQRVRKNAEKIMDKLQSCDPEGFRSLLDKYADNR